MAEHPRGSDRLLEQAIMLEALFQRGDEKTELSYRLSVRVAHFAGNTLARRREIFALVKKAYALRSRIAHGGASSATDGDVQQGIDALIPDTLMKYCRRAASDPAPKLHERICAELDDRLLERTGEPADE